MSSKYQKSLSIVADDKEALAKPELFTTDEAAHYTRMAIPTLHRFRLTGEGPVFAKLGGCVRYRRRDLDAWINSRLCRSTSDYPKQ
jgi:predicted DNA-binding transcriptional regulator AlpA